MNAPSQRKKIKQSIDFRKKKQADLEIKPNLSFLLLMYIFWVGIQKKTFSFFLYLYLFFSLYKYVNYKQMKCFCWQFGERFFPLPPAFKISSKI